jgi:hypothetical protein
MATDATRLASALHHFYDIQSYQQVFDKLRALETLPNSVERITYLQNTAYPRRIDPSKNTPAVDVRVLLYLLDEGKTPAQAWENISDGMMVLSQLRGSYMKGVSGRYPFLRFNWDGDVPYWALAKGAAFGRAAVQQTGKTRARHKLGFDNNAVEAARRWYSKDNDQTLGYYRQAHVEVDWLPFIRAEELCTLFAATTIRENEDSVSLMAAYSDAGLPLRWRVVRDNDRSGNLRGGAPSKVFYSNLPQKDGSTVRLEIDDLVRQTRLGTNPTSALELGLVRLVAAASFLQLQFVLNRRTSSYFDFDLANVDLIKQIKKNSAGPEFQDIEAPADPRQVVNGKLTPLGVLSNEGRVQAVFNTIVARERATAGALRAGAGAARSVAMKTLLMQQPSVWGQSSAGLRLPPSMLKRFTTKAAADGACLAAGGTYVMCQTPDGDPRRVCGKTTESPAEACARFGYQVPPTSAAAAAGAKQDRTKLLLLAAGAAVGAFFLLRR